MNLEIEKKPKIIKVDNSEIVAALVHDAIKTILAILSVVVSLIVLIMGLIFLFAG